MLGAVTRVSAASQVRLEADAARESARVEAERQAALARADVERQLMEEVSGEADDGGGEWRGS